METILDVARIASLVSGSGFRLHSYLFEGPEWAPWASYASSFGKDMRRLALPRSISSKSDTGIVELQAAFANATEEGRQRLRVPIDRLSNSRLAGLAFVDRAIELGISLESVFAPTKLGEGIGRTIRGRAAVFVGSTPEERRKMSQDIGQFYDLRSKAVHTGHFRNNNLPKTLRDDAAKLLLFGTVEEIVSAAIKKIVLIGEPDWDEMDIGNSLYS